MALTTERLREIAERSSPSLRWGEAEQIAAELLVNREAQPVASKCDQEVYANGKSVCLVAIPKETAEVICQSITSVTGCKVDWHYIGGRVHIKALVPPASVVTGELLEAMDEVIRISDRDHDAWNRAKEAIAACRAAMLAQPVSQGNKLNSPETPDGWIACTEQTPDADGAYWCWFGKEEPSVIQQRVCIWINRNNEWCDSAVTHWMPLPAAPTEGEKQ